MLQSTTALPSASVLVLESTQATLALHDRARLAWLARGLLALLQEEDQSVPAQLRRDTQYILRFFSK
jgi:hypothetical protein